MHRLCRWEMVVTFRKVCMTLISVWLQFDPYLQVSVAQFFMMLAVSAHVYAQPYVMAEVDAYEFVSLISSSLLFFFGALTNGDDSYASFASSGSIVVMASFLLYSTIFATYIAFKNFAKVIIISFNARSN